MAKYLGQIFFLEKNQAKIKNRKTQTNPKLL